MTDVTITPPVGSPVTFEIHERAGSLLLARDTGKLATNVYKIGTEEPLVSDMWSGIDSWTIVGQMTGADAYDDARTLAEDIVLPITGATSTLDLSDVSGLSTYDVVFPGSGAVKLHYPGDKNWVSVQLSAVVVETALGSEYDYTPSQAHTGSSNSVTLWRGGDAIEFDTDVTVKRTTGRPDRAIRKQPSDDPYAVDKPRAFEDYFELTGTFVGSATASATELVETFVKPRMGYATMQLEFGGLYTLGTYHVMADGAQALRTSWAAGEGDMVHVDKLRLMVVRSS